MLPSPMAFSPFYNSSRSLNLRTMAESCNSYLSCQNRDIFLILFKISHFLKGKARGGFCNKRLWYAAADISSAIQYCMSKVKVKFIYGGDHTVSVNQTHNGPINWNNPADTHTAAQTKQSPKDAPKQPSQSPKKGSIIEMIQQPKEEEFDKAIANALNTYKSAQTLPTIKSLAQRKESSVKKPVLNIEDANEAEFNQAKQKEPSLVVPEKKQKPLQQGYIRAPSYKLPPKNSGKGAKKEYTKGENAGYLYSGLPQANEDEFVGCFGCMRRKPKTYSVGKPK